MSTPSDDDVEEVVSSLVNVGFNKNRCRKALTKYLILDEFPFKHMEVKVLTNFV